MIAGSTLGAEWMGGRERARQYARLVELARRSAVAVDPDHVAGLAGSPADLGNSHYRRLKVQLQAMRNFLPNVRFVYLARMLQGRVVLLADSEPPGTKDESPPGQVYEEATPGFIGVCQTGGELAEGPVGDRWGSWVSGFFPIRDRRSGQVLAVLGVDEESGPFAEAVAQERCKALGLVAMICVAVLLSFYTHRRLRQILGQNQVDPAWGVNPWLRRGSAAAVALAVATLSAAVALERASSPLAACRQE